MDERVEKVEAKVKQQGQRRRRNIIYVCRGCRRVLTRDDWGAYCADCWYAMINDFDYAREVL